MRKIKLAIVEDNHDLCQILKDYFKNYCSDEFEVTGCAPDGESGFKIVSNTNPDIVLIDVMIPVIDGLGLLEKIKTHVRLKDTSCIMLSATSSDRIITLAINLGADFFCIKPFDFSALSNRIRQVLNSKKETLKQNYITHNNISMPFAANGQRTFSSDKSIQEEFLSTLLKEAGIQPSSKGYYYLKYAVLQCALHPQLINALTKELYPLIAKEYSTTNAGVERAMRSAISKAYEANPENSLNLFAVSSRNGKNSRPSSGSLIMSLVDNYKKRNPTNH